MDGVDIALTMLANDDAVRAVAFGSFLLPIPTSSTSSSLAKGAEQMSGIENYDILVIGSGEAGKYLA